MGARNRSHNPNCPPAGLVADLVFFGEERVRHHQRHHLFVAPVVAARSHEVGNPSPPIVYLNAKAGSGSRVVR